MPYTKSQKKSLKKKKSKYTRKVQGGKYKKIIQAKVERSAMDILKEQMQNKGDDGKLKSKYQKNADGSIQIDTNTGNKILNTDYKPLESGNFNTRINIYDEYSENEPGLFTRKPKNQNKWLVNKKKKIGRRIRGVDEMLARVNLNRMKNEDLLLPTEVFKREIELKE